MLNKNEVKLTITLDEAKQLTRGTTLYHVHNRNADRSPQRWRVNGMVKRWKRDQDRIEIPLKYGLWGYDYLTNDTLDLLCLDEDRALKAGSASLEAVKE